MTTRRNIFILLFRSNVLIIAYVREAFLAYTGWMFEAILGKTHQIWGTCTAHGFATPTAMMLDLIE
jgi:hypothetical protein